MVIRPSSKESVRMFSLPDSLQAAWATETSSAIGATTAIRKPSAPPPQMRATAR